MSDQDTSDEDGVESAPWGKKADPEEGAGPSGDSEVNPFDTTPAESDEGEASGSAEADSPFANGSDDWSGESDTEDSRGVMSADTATETGDGNPFDQVERKGGGTDAGGANAATNGAETSDTEPGGNGWTDQNTASGATGTTRSETGDRDGAGQIGEPRSETTHEQRRPEETDPTRGQFGTRNYTQDLIDFELVSDGDLSPDRVNDEGIVETPDGDYVGIASVSARSWSIHTEERKEQIIASYQSFLSSLDFYVQIVCYPGAFDISEHIDQLNEQLRTKQNAADESALVQWGRQLYPQWMQSFIEHNELTQRDYYMLVRVDPTELRNFESEEGALAKLADNVGPLGSLLESVGGSDEEQRASRTECIDEVHARLGQVERALSEIDIDVEPIRDTDEVLSVVYHYYNDRRPGRATFDVGTRTTHDSDAPAGGGRVPDDLVTTNYGGESS